MDENNAPTQPGGAKNPREAAMAAIAANAHAEVAGELQSFNEETGEIGGVEAAPATVKPAEHALEQPQGEAIETAPPQAEKPAPRMVKVIVDGQEREVEEEKILEAGRRTFQKETAADSRLAQASEALRQAQGIREQLLRASQDPSQQFQAPSSDAPQQPATADQATLVQVAQAVFYNGTAEQAAARFWEEFPEIAADPYLRTMAGQLEAQRMAHARAVGEPLGDPVTAYRKHGNAIREWLKQRTGTPAAATVQGKVDTKRTITNVPSANARAPAPAAEKQPTVSETIEAMRTSRTQGRRLFTSTH